MNNASLLPEHDHSVYAPLFLPGGSLTVGGVSVEGLIAEHGSPLYAYSELLLSSRIKALREAMPPELSLHFAVKANPNRDVVSHVASMVDGFDVASRGEIELLMTLGVDGERVSFAGPGKTAEELRIAISHNVRIVAESPHQLRLADDIARNLGAVASVMVRLNDQRQSARGGLSMTGSKSVFGWDIHHYREWGVPLFRELPNVHFCGFHLFSGTQILKASAIADGISMSTALLASIPVPTEPRLINLGGGLGIPYGPNDEPIAPTDLTQAWTNACADIQHRFSQASVCIELGRFIVGPAGIYVTRVVDKKRNGDRLYIVTDGGLHHFLAATGNFGQVLRRNHPVWPASPRPGPPELVTVVGCLCTPIDIFARDVALPPIEIGDLLVMPQAGAYGYSASPRDFLSHRSPAEVFLRAGNQSH